MQKFFKGVPLPKLHPSLNNQSKIDYMIATKRHAEHPYGQDIMENKTAYEVMNTLEFLQNCEEPGVADWVQDKRQSWMLASLSPTFTKKLPAIWTKIPFTTNAGESAHVNINRNGYELSLLAAIQKASKFDQLQWSSAYIYEKTNVSDSYRDKSSLQRTVEACVNKSSTSQKSSKRTQLAKNSTEILNECSELTIGS
ncbi:hypothetical protein C2G38_2206392 [Gigaspora rosea]|uniref:Uncharacterized protein n=1 Tax=Gigaspora rosea TaxID=44941 RepID=A0A397UJ76_9GLOM|nr:hypothetical protein C2G38_2206392 [Gigaspora rosea]